MYFYMSEIGASLLQLAANHSNETNSVITENIAIGYKIYNFNPNNELNINNPPIFDKINPECLILNINNDFHSSLIVFQTYISPLTLNFSIDNRNILKIPLSLLWNLNQPEIIDNKLYLKIPFDMFFGDINLCGLRNYDIKFSIDYSNIHLAGNYNMNIYHAQPMNFALLCRTHSIDQRELRFYLDVSNNSIQQISSIQIHSLNNINSDEFRIRTNRFRGFIKGFFIEATLVSQYLQEIKFYTNQFIRFHYDAYLIRQKCVKISDDMIYFPFNPQELFSNNTNNSYRGSINFDGIESHFLNLKFLHRRQKVRIYVLSKNNYSQRDNIFNIQTMYTSLNLYEDFNTHPLTPIDHLIQPFIQQQHGNLLDTGPVYDISLNDIPYISQVLNRKIGEDDHNTCPIQQSEIQENERYMLCSSCQNCYNEYAIISWFVSCNTYNRTVTCPTCRSLWSDHNVYVNAENEIPDENEIVQ